MDPAAVTERIPLFPAGKKVWVKPRSEREYFYPFDNDPHFYTKCLVVHEIRKVADMYEYTLRDNNDALSETFSVWECDIDI